ncbi:glycoside hydrolase family protein [Venturia nashicola]|uniref:1,3-beta-glucanosyltransferase n=1 Tax=Venturia nashicola TaxID=86259 RepID=A0A4Z1NR74_9PEZI|nr:glycoside hydrolase family 72 protein [Venturia nashicola]TLD28106.1 glycoside hydrolase family protein [Venturia nashicola]
MRGSSAFVATCALFSSTIASAVSRRANTISNTNTPPVSVKGNAFFTSKGRFYIRGVDYQPGGASANKDPIADNDGCKRDVAKFKELGINTIRVYSVDNSADHDTCMKLLADAGIYLALDVNTPYYSLNRKDNASIAMSYNAVYLQSVFATIEAFAKYDNTLLFYSANEVVNDDTTTFAAPYIKAVTRDMKAYMKARNLRLVPAGYSAADVESNRYEMATYLNCGPDAARSDFFAFNDYSWCDPSSYTISGWDKKVATYANYSLPLFLSEYGCNKNTRKFEEVKALYGSDMSPVYSGGLVYEYSQEEADYGLVDISGNTVSERPDFKALKSAFSGTPLPTGDGGYKSSGSASQCPPKSKIWEVEDPTILPTIPSGAQKYMTSGAGAGPGNKGTTGSQTASGASTGWSTPAAGSSTSGSASSSTTSKAAAGNLQVPQLSMAPFVVAAVAGLSGLIGGVGFLL